MDIEILKAKLNLQVIVPVLEDIVERDPEAAALVKGWNCVIQLQAGGEGDLAVYLRFAHGRVSAAPGRHAKPAVVLDFGTPQNVIANFGGGGEKLKPKIKGMWHIVILSKFVKLMSFIKRYLSPRDLEVMTPEGRALCAAALLRVSVLGMPELVAGDDAAKATASKIPDGTCQWKILPDGPVFNVAVSKGALAAASGDASSPAATVDFKDTDSALAVMTGKLNAMKALTSGALSIKGQTQLALMLSPLQDKVGKTLKG
jgi:hypothetical protein